METFMFGVERPTMGFVSARVPEGDGWAGLAAIRTHQLEFHPATRFLAGDWGEISLVE